VGLFFRFPTICSFKEFFASAVEMTMQKYDEHSVSARCSG
jgi:hypothetical protein